MRFVGRPKILTLESKLQLISGGPSTKCLFRYKLVVADAVVAYIQPIQERISQLLNDQGYLLGVLADGTEKASVIANTTLKEVHEKLGLTVNYRDSKKVLLES